MVADINIKWTIWPIGLWAKGEKYKVIGRLTLEDFLRAIDASLPFFMTLGWSVERVQKVLNAARDEIKDEKILLYQHVFVTPGNLRVCSQISHS